MTLHSVALLALVILIIKIVIIKKKAGLLLSLFCSLKTETKTGERATMIPKNLTLTKNQSELYFVMYL